MCIATNRSLPGNFKWIVSLLFTCLVSTSGAQSPLAGKDEIKAKSSQLHDLQDGQQKDSRFQLSWPPKLPGGQAVVSHRDVSFITKPAAVKLSEGVTVATTSPTVDFLYLPGQDYPGKLWSVWGDGSALGSKYYTSIGDHDSPRGEALVYEYDSKTRRARLLVSVRKYLESGGRLPAGTDYTPGKVHGRVDIGSDGWVYFSTHRGSTNDNTTDGRGYRGDHIYRVNPVDGKTEIVAAYPMAKHTIPASVLDPQRMIFYGGTNPGNDAPEKDIWFIAYDIKNKKMLKKVPHGFDRYAILSAATGCVYWKPVTPDSEKTANTLRSGLKYDPKTNNITPVNDVPRVRACTRETRAGIVYGFSQDNDHLWAFDTKKEKLTVLGPAMVGVHSYVTTVDLDPVTERYIYYVPGAHGGADVDGTPVVQYDVKTKQRKVIAFMSAFYKDKYQYMPDGTFSTALSPDGSILYVTWNGARKSPAKGWNTAAVTAIHIPQSERMP